MLVSDDQKTTVMFGVVPDPLLSTDRGCTVEAIRLLPKWELVLVRAKGFQPGAPVHFWMKSGDETQQREAEADSNGEYFAATLPFVKGEASGRSDVRVTSADCSPSVAFEWGKM